MIPYYFDLPSLEIPKEIFEIPYVQHPSDFMSPSGKGQGGSTFQYRAVPTNWYSVVKEHLDKKVNLKFGAITLLNTEPDGSSPWHAEGPNLFGRQCALNFMLVGDHENSYVQWASRGDEDIRTNDTRGAWWEADNLEAVDGTTPIDNLGGYDAVNRYGDEDTDGNLNDVTQNFNLNYFTHPGLKKFHRTGYMEKDIVDYDTKNIKTQASLHYMITPTTELIYSLNYSAGTTVYQGDNRISLKNIQFWQNKLELKQKDKFFVRAYRTQEDAGDSYDAVFTAIKLQEYNQISNQDWYTAYKNNWKEQFEWGDVNWAIPDLVFNPVTFEAEYFLNGNLIEINDWIIMSDSVLNANSDLLISNHISTRNLTDLQTGRLIPGSNEFTKALEDIISKTALEGGTGFYDKSALNHIHSEFQFKPDFGVIRIGANFRQYRPRP